DRLLAREGSGATGEEDAIIASWRLVRRKAKADPQTQEWIERQLLKAINVSVNMVGNLYYYWNSPKGGLVTDEGKNQIREKLYVASKTAMADGGSILSKVSPSNHLDIYHLVFPVDQDGVVSARKTPGDWAFLGTPLTKAA